MEQPEPQQTMAEGRSRASTGVRFSDSVLTSFSRGSTIRHSDGVDSPALAQELQPRAVLVGSNRGSSIYKPNRSCMLSHFSVSKGPVSTGRDAVYKANTAHGTPKAQTQAGAASPLKLSEPANSHVFGHSGHNDGLSTSVQYAAHPFKQLPDQGLQGISIRQSIAPASPSLNSTMVCGSLLPAATSLGPPVGAASFISFGLRTEAGASPSVCNHRACMPSATITTTAAVAGGGSPSAVTGPAFKRPKACPRSSSQHKGPNRHHISGSMVSFQMPTLHQSTLWPIPSRGNGVPHTPQHLLAETSIGVVGAQPTWSMGTDVAGPPWRQGAGCSVSSDSVGDAGEEDLDYADDAVSKPTAAVRTAAADQGAGLCTAAIGAVAAPTQAGRARRQPAASTGAYRSMDDEPVWASMLAAALEAETKAGGKEPQDAWCLGPPAVWLRPIAALPPRRAYSMSAAQPATSFAPLRHLAALPSMYDPEE